ncbi:MAG TPA: exosortase-associated EpsI family protein [Pirellulales bacterium]|nr:exosortase-associated EpsI family protein [Pirellulales bacterium]
MSATRRYILLLFAFVLTLGSGYLPGALARLRGGDSMSAAVDQLAETPQEFGPWQAQAELSLEPRLVEMLQCAGSVYRSYRNRETGDTVTLTLLVGPPGPTAVHTPEICFSSQGYHVESSPVRKKIELPGNASAEFWEVTFVPDQPDPAGPQRLTAWHSLSDGGAWTAPDYPRLVYATRPYLMKMQLASLASPESGDPCRSFLEAFLPALKRAGQ